MVMVLVIDIVVRIVRNIICLRFGQPPRCFLLVSWLWSVYIDAAFGKLGSEALWFKHQVVSSSWSHEG